MPKLLIVDTETGGTDAQIHSVLSVGAVVWSDGRLEDEIEVLVAETSPFADPEALKINCIDLAAHQAIGLPPALAADVLTDFIKRHFGQALRAGDRVVLAGHNVGFDIGFLRRLFRLGDGDYDSLFSHRSLDTASVLRFLAIAGLLPQSVTSSDAAFAHFGVTPSAHRRHTALGDAHATALLLSELVDRVRGLTLPKDAAA